MKYHVTDAYGATYEPWSKAAPHKGDDYALPMETPLYIGSTMIGRVGMTGQADGPHVHVQAGRDEWAQTPINPRPYSWKGGTVVRVGEVSEWGKYVCLKVGNVYVYYCHLNEQTVKVGQVIKEEEVFMIEVQPPVFNAKYYLAQNKDVAKRHTVATAAEHWLRHGIKEGRPAAPNFHVKEYLANYGDLRKAYGDKGYARAVPHYFNHGLNEGRSGRSLRPTDKGAELTRSTVLDYLTKNLK